MGILKQWKLVKHDWCDNQWWRPGAEFGEDGKCFSGPRLLNDGFFGKKFPFSGQNFLMTFFSLLVIDLVFRIFPFFSQIFRIFTILNVVYDPFLTRKTSSFILFIYT